MKHAHHSEPHHRGHGSFATYAFGFLFSILLTISAFSVALSETFSRPVKISAILWLAIVQLIVQLMFFLHVGSEPKSRPKWQLLAFSFAVLIVGIIVCGSLWIMQNLTYNMMPAAAMDAQMISDEAFDLAH